MYAIRLEEPRLFRGVEIDEPAPPGPGEVLVATHRMGICGSDVGGYLGKMPFFRYPRIPGHELGVEVLAVGDGVTQVRPGDRCSVEKNDGVSASPRTCSGWPPSARLTLRIVNSVASSTAGA